MNKKGFTLVELLAVIAILALLVILAMPNIINLFNNARKNTFVTEARTLFKEAESQYINEQFKGNNISRLSSSNKKTQLDLSGKKLDYCVILDENGKVTKFAAGNDKFHILSDNIDVIDSIDETKVEDGPLGDIICSKNLVKKRNKCTYDGDLVQGVEYVNGQYTYKYNASQKGWSVVLTDKQSTEPVTTELCNKINDKPIISMADMFRSSKTTKINLESFDTSNVTNMSYMFADINNILNLNFSTFDTANVENMKAMFFRSAFTNLNLESFDTSNVKSMHSLFSGCSSLSDINLSSFNTTNVEQMDNMFYGSAIKNLDLSNFNTSNVKSLSSMFNRCDNLIYIDLSSFDTSKVFSMDHMFYSCSKLEKIDLSNFKTQSLTSINYIFDRCSKLKYINLSNADFSNITTATGVFDNAASTAQIYLKNTTNNIDFINNNYPNYTINYVN